MVAQGALGNFEINPGPQADMFTPIAEVIKLAEKRDLGEEKSMEPLRLGLAGVVENAWQIAKDEKEPIDQRLIAILRAKKLQYDPTTAALIVASGQPNVYLDIIGPKRRSLTAWGRDLLGPDLPFDLTPTEIPELSEEDQQHAKLLVFEQNLPLMMSGQLTPEDSQGMGKDAETLEKRTQKALKKRADEKAVKMRRYITDDIEEGGWLKELKKAITDVSDYPTAFLRDPVYRKKQVLEWQNGRPVPVEKQVKCAERISPFDVYPMPGSHNWETCDYIIRHKWTVRAIQKMIGSEGYDEDVIRAVLTEYGKDGHRIEGNYDQERYQLETGSTLGMRTTPGIIEALEFVGHIRGEDLLEYGMSPDEISDPEFSYSAIVVCVDRHVLYAGLNPHPLDDAHNLHTCSSTEDSDTLWPESLTERLFDIQSIVNSLARAIVKNAGFSAGPQSYIYEDLMPDTADSLTVVPYKQWRFSAQKMSASGVTGIQKPIGFFQSQMVAHHLLTIVRAFDEMASKVSDIPSYMTGDQKIGGGGKTKGGLAMLFAAASKTMKLIAGYVDDGLIVPSIYQRWVQMMMFEPDKALGDAKVVARASAFLAKSETEGDETFDAMARIESLPAYATMVPQEGKKHMLRTALQSQPFDIDEVVPDEEMGFDEQLQQAIQAIAQGTGMDPNQLMQIAQQARSGGGVPGGGPSPSPGGQMGQGDPNEPGNTKELNKATEGE